MKQTFIEWKEKVDAHIQKICGLTTDDLADQCYHDWYDSGMRPANAAKQALESENFYD